MTRNTQHFIDSLIILAFSLAAALTDKYAAILFYGFFRVINIGYGIREKLEEKS